MNVQSLITILQSLSPDVEVRFVWDGRAYGDVDVVWESRSGEVMMSSNNESIYDDEDRPAYAPSETEDFSWQISAKTHKAALGADDGR